MDTKKWYKSKTIWLAILTGISGVVIALSTQYPAAGALVVLKSLIDIALRYATELPLSS